MGGVGVCVGRGRWFLTFCSWNVTPWSHCCPESCADCCGHQAAAVDVTPSGHHLSVCWIWGSPEHTTLGHQKRYVYIYCWFSWSAFDWLIRFTLYLTWQQSRNAEALTGVFVKLVDHSELRSLELCLCVASFSSLSYIWILFWWDRTDMVSLKETQ